MGLGSQVEKHRESSRVLGTVIRLGTVIERSTGLACVVLFGTMIVTAILGVFFRYVMNNPFQWTEEIARYTLIWLGFTAISMAIWRKEHITIPFLVEMLPGPVSKCLSVAVHLLIGAYMYILLTKGYRMASNTMMTAQSMQISMYWFYLAVPVSALLSLVQITLSLIRTVISPAHPKAALQD